MDSDALFTRSASLAFGPIDCVDFIGPTATRLAIEKTHGLHRGFFKEGTSLVSSSCSTRKTRMDSDAT